MTRWKYVRPILAGLAILAVGLLPWTFLAQWNRQVRPELPWAAVLTVAYLVVLVGWLHGFGPPSATAAARRWSLRLAPHDIHERPEGLSSAALIALLMLLYVAWILMSRLSPLPDLTAYPTTAYRWSMFLMGGIMAGLVEEVAFRGYMQTGLERIDPHSAVWITSLVFVLSHVTQGVGAVVLLGPGLFVASMLFGTLAQRTGSIAPGIAIHILGDLSRAFFGVLRGDVDLLFAS
ncbi:MAG: CPBP family intramembrane metalloprotease [Gemmatimonadaceae bacterium]|nr:CPBP family intramembrane metalloprotease [Gemmatimonadaceae bacterium]